MPEKEIHIFVVGKDFLKLPEKDSDIPATL